MKFKNNNQQEYKNVSEKNIVRCIHCHSENYIKKGFRITENRGKVRRYYCKDCHRFFTNNDGFYRMRYSAQTITLSVDMYLSNLSSRKMRNQLKRHFQYIDISLNFDYLFAFGKNRIKQ